MTEQELKLAIKKKIEILKPMEQSDASVCAEIVMLEMELEDLFFLKPLIADKK